MSFYSVREMSMRYPSFPQGSFRWLIFNADTNGFHKCVVRPQGIRKVLIDELEFLKWLKYNPNQDSKYNNKPKPGQGFGVPSPNEDQDELNLL